MEAGKAQRARGGRAPGGPADPPRCQRLGAVTHTARWATLAREPPLGWPRLKPLPLRRQSPVPGTKRNPRRIFTFMRKGKSEIALSVSGRCRHRAPPVPGNRAPCLSVELLWPWPPRATRVQRLLLLPFTPLGPQVSGDHSAWGGGEPEQRLSESRGARGGPEQVPRGHGPQGRRALVEMQPLGRPHRTECLDRHCLEVAAPSPLARHSSSPSWLLPPGLPHIAWAGPSLPSDRPRALGA